MPIGMINYNRLKFFTFQIHTMIPLMVDCTGRPVTIFGGGAVGARKARYFSDEADVTVYSRSFSPSFQSIPVRQIQAEISIRGEQIDEVIRGAFLVVAATSDPDLNKEIIERCTRKGILCNNATTPAGSVTLPAKYTGNRFTIAVSTKGASPGVSRFIREHMEACWPDLDQMIMLEEEFRQILKEQGISESRRREILADLLHDPEAWLTLSQGIGAALRYAEEKYPA
jgi:precorrin-2 dehydrogenase/sirohydrochlorin ferrochelatase